MRYRNLIVIGLIIISAAGNVFLFFRQRSLSSQLEKSREEAAQLARVQQGIGVNPAAESARVVEQVGKLVVLPENEQPTVATVTDLEKLKGQDFFAPAQVGDKVLIFTKSAKVILYRPSENKIIALAPLLMRGGSATTTPNF